MIELDIVIPVYNERENIVSVLDSFHEHVKTAYRVLICYDSEEDTTLEAIARYPKDRMEIVLVKNPGRGPHDAMREGFSRTNAPFILTHMGDDDYTAPVIDFMMEKAREGYEIVTGGRFMKGAPSVANSTTGASSSPTTTMSPTSPARNPFATSNPRFSGSSEFERSQRRVGRS